MKALEVSSTSAGSCAAAARAGRSPATLSAAPSAPASAARRAIREGCCGCGGAAAQRTQQRNLAPPLCAATAAAATPFVTAIRAATPHSPRSASLESGAPLSRVASRQASPAYTAPSWAALHAFRAVAMRRGARLLALALLLLAAVPAALGALLAVDYGSEWIKAALVAPGRAPVSIVLNEASKRKSLAAVAFSGGERTLGDDAAALSARYPERVVLRARDLLGRPANGSALAAALAARYSPHVPSGAPGRGTVTLPAHGGAAGAAQLSAEQLAASVLHYARRCAEAQAGATIRDAVVTVPPYWSQAQRSALADAASLAGLNLLSLVSEPAAAALQYGIDRETTAVNATDLVVLYDMGAGKASAALVAYSSWKAKEGGKPKTYGQYEIKALAWDETAGGEALDVVLAGATRHATPGARQTREAAQGAASSGFALDPPRAARPARADRRIAVAMPRDGAVICANQPREARCAPALAPSRHSCDATRLF